MESTKYREQDWGVNPKEGGSYAAGGISNGFTGATLPDWGF